MESWKKLPKDENLSLYLSENDSGDNISGDEMSRA
jgi:hypothetical protein